MICACCAALGPLSLLTFAGQKNEYRPYTAEYMYNYEMATVSVECRLRTLCD